MPRTIKKALTVISDIQMAIVMIVFYVVFLWPFAIYVRLLVDCFGIKTKRSQWHTGHITSTDSDLTKQY